LCSFEELGGLLVSAEKWAEHLSPETEAIALSGGLQEFDDSSVRTPPGKHIRKDWDLADLQGWWRWPLTCRTKSPVRDRSPRD
jgi:hypothetical protein